MAEQEYPRLSSEGRQLMTRISATLGRTADVILAEAYDSVSPDYARGYMAGVIKQATDDEILKMYFLSRLFTIN